MDSTSSQGVAEFRYSPLPSTTSTRFIELLPAADPWHEIRCRLKTVDLDRDSIPYEALSYTWGDGALARQIHVSTGEGSEERQQQWAVLRVTENLWSALRRFRKPSKPRVIWADAVCINQGDASEKDAQIPGMVDIYRTAKKVLVWLGGCGETEKAMTRFGVLGHRILRRENTLSVGEVAELAACACALLSMPWFSRRWVIQEVVFSPNVVVFAGAESISLPRMASILELPRSFSSQAPPQALESFLVLNRIRNSKICGDRNRKIYGDRNRKICGQPPDDCGLLQLMRVFDHFGCSDPVDRIFTIAQLAHDVELRLLPAAGSRGRNLELAVRSPPASGGEPAPRLRGVEISYADAPEHVFARFAEFVADSGYFAWVLGQAMARADGASRASSLPSWIPDWSIPRRRQPLWIETHQVRGLCEQSLTPPFDERPVRDVTLPTIARRSDGNGYRLRAAVCHTEYWPSTLDQCVEDPASKSAVELDSIDLVRTMVAPLRHDMIFPLSIDFKTEPFPEQDGLRGAAAWIRDSFLSTLAHVLPPEQFSIFMAAGPGPERWKGLPGRYLERFSCVVTANAMFFGRLAVAERANLLELARSAPAIYKSKYGCSPDLVCPPNPLIPLGHMVVPILALAIDSSNGDELDAAPLLQLISITMMGRCVISCDYVGSTGACLQPGPSSQAMRVLGISSPHVEKGDSIMSLQAWFENRISCYFCFPPDKEETLPASAPGHPCSSDCLHYEYSSKLVSDRHCWTFTYIVRPRASPGQNEGRRPRQVEVKRIVKPSNKYLLCSRLEVPRLELLSDCYLSTLQWKPDLFHEREHPLGDMWRDLRERWHRGDPDPMYKTVSSSASVMDFDLV